MGGSGFVRINSYIYIWVGLALSESAVLVLTKTPSTLVNPVNKFSPKSISKVDIVMLVIWVVLKYWIYPTAGSYNH